MVSYTMFTITSLPILLCLFLSTQQLKITSNPLKKGSSEPVRLGCQTEAGESVDFGVFWFRHRTGDTSPESIVYYSSVGRATYKDTNDANNHFKPGKSGSEFSLSIPNFNEKDQGTYYCLINKNSVLHISPGHQLIYPEVTTPKPKLTKAPTAPPTQAKNPCNCPSGSKEPELSDLSCDLYVWAPLAGICGCLLICLFITSIMLCCRTRRRRCRCKPRPMDEKNGNMNFPKRQI